ncbi:hypothetical protein ABEV62_01140, partial [Pseudobacillus badius]
MRFIAAKVSSTCIGNFFNHSSRCPSSVLFAEPDHSLAQADPERFYLLVLLDGMVLESPFLTLSSLYNFPLFVHSVDWNGRRADSSGICGTGETPLALWLRGGSPP